MSNIQEAIKEIDEMIGHTIGPFGEEPECDSLRSIKKLLESEPEPGEFTKKTQAGVLKIIQKKGEVSTPENGLWLAEHLQEACDRIDRLTAENKRLKEEIKKRDGAIGVMGQISEILHKITGKQNVWEAMELLKQALKDKDADS